jgi:hypothetical protein
LKDYAIFSDKIIADKEFEIVRSFEFRLIKVMQHLDWSFTMSGDYYILITYLNQKPPDWEVFDWLFSL